MSFRPALYLYIDTFYKGKFMSTSKVSDTYFNKAINQLVAQFGKGASTRGLAEVDLKAIPTGHDDLDELLTKGARGIYLGGIIEIFGNEGSGKTSLALRTVGNAQKMGYHCAWFDCESGFDEGIAKLNGVDPTQLILPELVETSAIQKKSEEGESISLFNAYEVLEMVYKFVVSDAFGLIVLDSVAGLMPERILSDSFDPNKSAAPAEVARALSDMLRKIAPACKQTETSVIFINQKRDQPGAWAQNPYHTPGGRALKFFSHQRINVEKKGGAAGQVWADIDGKGELIGHYAKTKIVKNKKAPPVPPDVEIEIPIYYRVYFPDLAQKCYKLARDLKVVKIHKGVLTWKENDDIILKETGESDFLSALREGKFEAQLAAACMAVDQSDAKKDIAIPTAIKELADSYKPDAPKKTKKKTKATSDAAIDLDE